MTGEPIPRRSVAELLADRLRTAILDGRFSPGAPLREVALAEAYDVSRHTVRSGLKLLEVEGLVAIIPQRGASVAVLAPQRMVDLFALRTALELEAAHLALHRNERRLPDVVHAALGDLVAAAGRGRPSWKVVADRHAAFHSALVSASESPRIIAAYEGLATEMQLFLVHLRPGWPLARMGPHHQQLVSRLEAGDEGALRAHIAEGLEAALAASSPDGFDNVRR